jgi:hypothetical protein
MLLTGNVFAHHYHSAGNNKGLLKEYRGAMGLHTSEVDFADKMF